jgi:hypothetical protein
MLDPSSFRNLIIDPTLKKMKLYSEVASNLLLGTALQESRLHHLKQIRGPALGLYQVEPTTHHDLYVNYINNKPHVAVRLDQINFRALWNNWDNWPSDELLITNLEYATAICRLIYFRRPEPLPSDPGDIQGLAEYWKRHYNTNSGAGTAIQYKSSYLHNVK